MKYLILVALSTAALANPTVETHLNVHVATTSSGYTGKNKIWGKCGGGSDDRHNFADQSSNFQNGNGAFTSNFSSKYTAHFVVSASGFAFDYYPRTVETVGSFTHDSR